MKNKNCPRCKKAISPVHVKLLPSPEWEELGIKECAWDYSCQCNYKPWPNGDPFNGTFAMDKCGGEAWKLAVPKDKI